MDEITRVRVDDQGRLMLPASLRRRMGISSGDTVLAAVEEDGRLVVWTFENGVRRAQEIARRHIAPGSYTVDDFLGERREEARRAERRVDSVDGEDRAAS